MTPPKKSGTTVELSEELYEHLSDNARKELDSAVAEYAAKVVSEARNIENMEHVGDPPPEITGAHIQEAKWVSLRRLRVHAQALRGGIVLRSFQLIATLVLGLGLANYSEWWGPLTVIAGVLIASISLIIEIGRSKTL